jgi:hypothetical protein
VAFLAALPIRVKSEEVPRELKTNAECMLAVLKIVPEVSEPRLGSATVTDGTTHFWSIELPRGYAVRNACDLTRKSPLKVITGFWRIYPAGGNPEIHVTELIIRSWKTQCGVSANVIFP